MTSSQRELKRNSMRGLLKYQAYLDQIKNSKCKIDNSPPFLPTAFYYNIGELRISANRLQQIEKENRAMLKIINTIYRTHGKVDCHLTGLIKYTNYYERISRNKKIEKQNLKIYNILQSVQANYSYKKLIEEYKKNLQKVIFASHNPQFYLDNYMVPELSRWDIIDPYVHPPLNAIPPGDPKRVRCFMDVGVDEKTGIRKLGRMLIEVYREYAPKQSDHFLNLINGYRGLSYKKSPFHRIQKGFACVGGDVTKNSGIGVYSIFDECYPNENNLLQFNGPGVISSFSLKSGHNHCQFLISFRKLSVLNKEFTVFGRVIKNLGTLQRIEEFGSTSGSPIRRIIITNCGIFGNKNFLKDTLKRYPKLNLGQRLTRKMMEEKRKLAEKAKCGCHLYRLVRDGDSTDDNTATQDIQYGVPVTYDPTIGHVGNYRVVDPTSDETDFDATPSEIPSEDAKPYDMVREEDITDDATNDDDQFDTVSYDEAVADDVLYDDATDTTGS